MNERSTDTLIRSRVREKESGIDESVLLATSHGLRMLPGHEELVSLRLLVHERRGEHGAGRMYRADRDSTSRVR